jgi:hypothetical protein
MSTEQGPRPNHKPEMLTQDQEHLSRELFIHRFWVNYLDFQEFDKSTILFQTDLVKDKGEYTIIFPHEETEYLVPYESLDMAFIDIFEKDLEDPDNKPVNFRQDIIINSLNHGMPSSLKEYFGKTIETMETVYPLKPIDGKRRTIWQTTFLDQVTGAPIAEIWEAIIEREKAS